MKLTIEENRDTITIYSHIKPAPFWGPARCSASCPGSVRTCTLEKGHTGLHVAHSRFRRVVAVWDNGIEDRKPVRGVVRRDSREGELVATMKALLRIPSIEEAFLLILALAFVGFGIDWALRILGVW